MSKRFTKLSSWDSLPGARQLIKEINIKRIPYIAVIVIIFELTNLIFKTYTYLHSFNSIMGMIGMIALILISTAYIIIIKLLYQKIIESEIFTRFIYLSFWGMIIACLTPFLINDIMIAKNFFVHSPLNIVLLCMILIVIPIFFRIELCFLYFGLFIYNLGLILIYTAPIVYSLYVFIICFSSFLISFFVQYQYINMIVNLNFEVRIDYLTGIMNRRGGIDKINTILELCKRQGGLLAIYMIDIDYFKSYNDKFGHIKGDDVLKKVAGAILNTYSRGSDVVCRYGGEEFLVCSVIKNKTEAENMAKKLQNNILELKIEASNKTVSEYLTVSIGYVIYSVQSDDITTNVDNLIDYADKALYEAKNTGRNKISSNDYLIVNNANTTN